MDTFRKVFALALVAVSGVVFAGDCGDCAGRQGLLARRADRKASRSCCSAPATSSVVTEEPAVIRTEAIYQTRKVGEKVTIVPAGAAGKKAGSK